MIKGSRLRFPSLGFTLYQFTVYGAEFRV